MPPSLSIVITCWPFSLCVWWGNMWTAPNKLSCWCHHHHRQHHRHVSSLSSWCQGTTGACEAGNLCQVAAWTSPDGDGLLDGPLHQRHAGKCTNTFTPKTQIHKYSFDRDGLLDRPLHNRQIQKQQKHKYTQEWAFGSLLHWLETQRLPSIHSSLIWTSQRSFVPFAWQRRKSKTAQSSISLVQAWTLNLTTSKPDYWTWEVVFIQIYLPFKHDQ